MTDLTITIIINIDKQGELLPILKEITDKLEELPFPSSLRVISIG